MRSRHRDSSRLRTPIRSTTKAKTSTTVRAEDTACQRRRADRVRSVEIAHAVGRRPRANAVSFAGRSSFDPSQRLLSRVLRLLFSRHEIRRADAERRAAARRTQLSTDEARELHVPFPPLPEQQRIVGILDEAFDGIATAKANAEKNLQNARALFESHLQSVFTQRGKGWVEKRLGECCATLITDVAIKPRLSSKDSQLVRDRRHRRRWTIDFRTDS